MESPTLQTVEDDPSSWEKSAIEGERTELTANSSSMDEDHVCQLGWNISLTIADSWKFKLIWGIA